MDGMLNKFEKTQEMLGSQDLKLDGAQFKKMHLKDTSIQGGVSMRSREILNSTLLVRG